MSDDVISKSFLNSNPIVKFANKYVFEPYLTLKPEKAVESVLYAVTHPSSEIGGKYISHGHVSESSGV